MRKIYYFAILVLFSACLMNCGGGNSTKTTADTTNNELKQPSDSSISDKTGAADATKSDVGHKSTFELLQGKWQSTDDKTNFLVFEKNHRKEANIVNGKGNWDDEVFVISDKCKNETDKNEEVDAEKDKYISCAKSDLCWYILKLDDTTLSLSYMGRGNTLTYKRVK